MYGLNKQGRIAVAAVVIVALVLGGVAFIPVGARANGENPLAEMLVQTDLKYRELDEEGWVIPFEGENDEIIDVYLTYNNEKRKFAMIFTTVVDRDPEYEFSRDLLEAAMRLNNDYPGVKFCLDQTYGDIDCQAEVYMETITPESLDMYINLVAALALSHSATLNELARDEAVGSRPLTQPEKALKG